MSIKTAVITVPYHFGQAERRAVIRAAQMADIDVLQLINSNTAVALNYGLFRRKFFNQTAQSYMFYDMGSLGLTVTIVCKFHSSYILFYIHSTILFWLASTHTRYKSS
ncbi:unnamed protein product [Protopolystoma xenopodis]|uniref:Hypoxia up-regulated protein 1 n=1 Tax=Protopolystoma xenopodis TaxID=117903 RepID=A0A3S5AJH9_9PLAT|nr:unnamed protein product [Protopolystoma xenopodis]